MNSPGGETATKPQALVKPRSPTSSTRLPPAGLLLATLLTFSSTFYFGWVYDDPPQIPQNSNLQWSRLGFLFTHQLWASTVAAQGRFYRPLLTLWFLLNKTVFGLNPHSFHVTTVLAHAGATVLAFFVIRSLLDSPGLNGSGWGTTGTAGFPALFGAGIFGLHPLQAESASWISAVNDPLAAIFSFGSFLIYRKALAAENRRGLWWTLAAVFFLCALFTKEVAIVLPAIILIDWLVLRLSNAGDSGSARSKPYGSALLPVFCAYGITGSGWLALRSWVLRGPVASAPVSWSTMLFSAPKIILFDLYRMILPIGLSPQYDFRLIDSPASPQFLASTLALAALVVLAVRAGKRDSRLWVGLAWVLLPILPTLNLRWMNQDDFIHDRYTYISLLGFGFLAAAAYQWIRAKWPNQAWFRSLAAAIILAQAFASAIQSQFWANNMTLFSRAIKAAPENEWAQMNYGAALSARGNFGDAAAHFVSSFNLKANWRAADFAGLSYLQMGELSQAESWFRLALQQYPGAAEPWFGLGEVRLRQQRPQEAIPLLDRAIELDPAAEGFHYELGVALEQASELPQAVAEYQAELQQHPSDTAARSALDRLQASQR